jgi:NADH:ubiquinone oxidoreductase subunit 6 (subunit J)
VAETIAFWSLAVVLVGSALAVVLSKNLFHSVLWLALALTGTAGVFLLLEAEFLAAVQLLLYAGGVVTIVVFAIVVTERLVGERITQTNRRITAGAVVALAFVAFVVNFISQQPLAATQHDRDSARHRADDERRQHQPGRVRTIQRQRRRDDLHRVYDLHHRG